MNKNLTFLLLICFIASCKKEEAPVNIAEVKILKTITTINSNKEYLGFDYDVQGRVTRISQNTNNAPAVTKATLTYNGNEILITGTPVITPNVNITYETRYLMDANKNQAQRIQAETQRYFSPHNHQNTFITDTTYYEYDATGLLIKTINSSRDSTWNLPGTAPTVTKMVLNKINLLYANSNGNLSSGNGTGTRFMRTFDGTITTEFNSIIEKSIAFDYSSGYANKTDFNNIFILNEYKIIFSPPFTELPFYTINKNYKNIPNQVDHMYSETTTGGSTIRVIGGREIFTAAYNKYGFLTGMLNSGGSNSSIDLVYNK